MAGASRIGPNSSNLVGKHTELCHVSAADQRHRRQAFCRACDLVYGVVSLGILRLWRPCSTIGASHKWRSAVPFPYQPADFIDYMEGVRRDHAGHGPTRFAIAELPSDDLVGSLALDVHPNGSRESGYWYGRRIGRAVTTTEAAKSAVMHALNCPSIRLLTAITGPENEACHRVLLKLAFITTGMRGRERPSRRGTRSVHVYGQGNSLPVVMSPGSCGSAASGTPIQ